LDIEAKVTQLERGVVRAEVIVGLAANEQFIAHHGFELDRDRARTARASVSTCAGFAARAAVSTCAALTITAAGDQ